MLVVSNTETCVSVHRQSAVRVCVSCSSGDDDYEATDEGDFYYRYVAVTRLFGCTFMGAPLQSMFRLINLSVHIKLNRKVPSQQQACFGIVGQLYSNHTCCHSTVT